MKECIIWPGYLDKDGYGQINSNKYSTLRTARIVLEENLGRKIRTDHQAHHICYNRACVNPRHIVERTPTENTRDKYFPDRPKYDKYLLTKDVVYLVLYLLKRGTCVKDISNRLNIIKISKESETLVNIPTKIILSIQDEKVWEFIHLYNWQKVIALISLENFIPSSECIEADWGSDINIYPVVQKNKKLIRAARFAYRVFNKRVILEGLVLRHSCDNVRCIRPSHLSTGTQLSNMDDKKRKGRDNREKSLDGKEKDILRLRDKEGMSFRAIGIHLAKQVNRDRAYDHKMIITRYKNYKQAIGEKIPKRKLSQRQLLLQNGGILLQLRDKEYYSFSRISKELGKQLLDGDKGFDQQLVKKIYIELKEQLNEKVPPTRQELLIQNKNRLISLTEEKKTWRAIAKILTEELNLPSPLHHTLIQKLYKRFTNH